MKKLLLISPYFVPSNAPDMHRTRICLPYYLENGWEVELVCVNDKYSEFNKDKLLWDSIPKNIKIHYVNALSNKITSKLGLGNLGLRSLPFYKKKVDNLLRKEKFDLIYFSTTHFSVSILGAYWKKKFKVPFVIDMQDPWHTEYYRLKPKNERPPKYWFSYRLNKYLEPIAMRQVDGLISVSPTYLDELQSRYNNITNVPKKVITFGYADIDLEIAKKLPVPQGLKKSIKYIGVLGVMMHKSLEILFNGLQKIPSFQQEYQLIFKGTSYAKGDYAIKTTEKIASKYKIYNIIEDTNRLGLYDMLAELSSAEGLLIIGTDDSGYTASKLYPYLQTGKPILAVLHPNSSANETLKAISNAIIISIDDNERTVNSKITQYIKQIEQQTYQVNLVELKKYSAQNLTKQQCLLFNQVVSKHL